MLKSMRWMKKTFEKLSKLALTNFVYADKPADKFTDVGVTHWAYNT